MTWWSEVLDRIIGPDPDTIEAETTPTHWPGPNRIYQCDDCQVRWANNTADIRCWWCGKTTGRAA